MSIAENAFREAYAAHRSGEVQRAEEIYRQVLEKDAGHIEALHLLGLCHYQQGRNQEAVECFLKAISGDAKNPAYHSNLGLAYRALGMLNEAGDCFEQTLRIRPNHWAAYNNLGVVRLEQGRPEEAASCFEQARRFNSADPDAHCNLGKALLQQKRFDLAVQNLQKAIELKPDFVDAYVHLGLALRSLKQLEQAGAAFEKATQLEPNHCEALCQLGSYRVGEGRAEEGEALLRKALELAPRSAPAFSNLGVALKDQGRFDEAIDAFQRALDLLPDFSHAANNMGATYLQLGQWDDAVRCFEDALRIRPNYADARWNRSLAWLTLGNFEQGLIEYEWRWHRENTKPRTIPRPLWNGAAVEGKTILLHAEQGLGDTLQFVRYARLVAEKGLKVLLACQAPLVPLLSLLPHIDKVVPYQPALPPFQCHAPLLSLPNIFRQQLDSIPREVPYLRAAPELVEKWREPITQLPGLKIGIAWQGNPKFAADGQRSIPLKFFEALAQVPGVTLVNLQRGFGVEQLDAASFPIHRLPEDVDGAAGAFMDTAAIIQHLDLVCASDSAIVHLAGGLGKAVALPLAFAGDWRWLTGREDSPWYPRTRIFRQPQRNEWRSVFAQIAVAVAQFQEHSWPPSNAGQTASDPAIQAGISIGELLDKITILQIKAERISDPIKLNNVRRELALLAAARDRGVPQSSALADLARDLKGVNESLWEIEDQLRRLEAAGDFGDHFVQLARLVYRTNDRRAAIKREINRVCGSALVEEKSYVAY